MSSPFAKVIKVTSVYMFFIVVMISCQVQETATKVKPEDNRFTTTILTEPNALDEPMAFTFLNNEEMLIAERKGGLKSLNVETRELKKIADIPTNIIYTNKEGQSRPAEEGLMGITAHPDYAQNNFIYMFYADPDEPKHVLARWNYANGTLDENSKKVVLEYKAQREVCCHTGGGMAWDKNNNLYLTTGNNTANPPSGTSNLDERPGYETSDDQRTAGNTNDLRGKILRIHPEDDGSYTIPEGNLFPEGTEKTRPEIYTMGHRNPWRVSVDSETGYIYWGEVGPDASDSTARGPKGFDEFNQAKEASFHGWPYFIGDNIPYNDFDHTNDSVGAPFDVSNPVNTSANNTGLTELPKPVPAFIWYPYGFSEEFPLMGSAGRSATGGPVFRQADFPASDKRFPAYYEGKWLMVEFMRGWIMSVSMDANGDYAGMERFLPNEDFISAIDMIFSPDGDLYVLEYGSAWFQGNDNALVKRVQYNGGNRTPVVMASADKTAGSLPLTVELSSDGTIDYDNDDLDFNWSISSDNGFSQNLSEANPSLTLEEAGTYAVTLSVTDEANNSNEQTFEIVAGNAPPMVDIAITSGNKSFFFPGKALTYNIIVTDEEDGSVENGSISPEQVAVNFDYAPEGFDLIEIAQNHRATEEWVSFSRGQTLIQGSDCFSCHKVEVASIGPSYLQVAEKYAETDENKSMLADRILNGSVGIWGEHAMAAHPNFSKEEALLMVDYILDLDEAQQDDAASIPLSGTYVTEVPEGQNGKGGYLLRAAYFDNGAGNLRSLADESIIALRNPVINVERYDVESGTQLLTTPGRSFYLVEDGAYVGFSNLDFTGVSEIIIVAEAPGRVDAAGGVMEVRLDDPNGTLVGTTEQIVSVDIDFRAEMGKMIAEWEAGGQKGPRPGFRDVREKFRPKWSVPLEGIEGFHDVYFVIKNAEAAEGQILVSMDEVEFKATE